MLMDLTMTSQQAIWLDRSKHAGVGATNDKNDGKQKKCAGKKEIWT